MTTHADIAGVGRCQGREHAQDLVDAQVWAILEAKHPGLMDDVLELKGMGERLHIPKSLETKREQAKRLDDGVMSVRDLADLAGCCCKTVRRARKEKSRE